MTAKEVINYCIMPEQPYCPACHYGYIVYDENDDTHCEWNCLLTEEEYELYQKRTGTQS